MINATVGVFMLSVLVQLTLRKMRRIISFTFMFQWHFISWNMEEYNRALAAVSPILNLSLNTTSVVRKSIKA
jgi:hypothetical protein